MQRAKTLISFFIVSWGLIHCGPSTFSTALDPSGENSDETTEYSGVNLEGGAVTEIDIDNETGEGIIDFSGLEGSEEFILVLYSYDANGENHTFGLSSLNDNERTKVRLLANDEEISFDDTEDFHQMLREAEEELDVSETLSSPHALVKAAEADPKTESRRSFKILNSLSTTTGYTSVTAVLKHKNQDILGYVDERDVENFLTDEELISLLDRFGREMNQVRSMFGEESDIDGNGRIVILFSRVVNQMSASSGGKGIITGFFYGGDLTPASQQPASNEMEILYTYVPDSEGKSGTPISKSFSLSNIYSTVFPHEFQHMINFNQHSLVREGSSEEPWLNEALAHLAEGIATQDDTGYMKGPGYENWSRFGIYLRDPAGVCITCGATLPQRGGVTLLLRYVYEQAQKGLLPSVGSGNELLWKLVNTELIGEENLITAAYGGGPVDLRFRDLLGQFGLTLFLSQTGLSSDPRLNFDINLRSPQNDNRGTVLQGPSIQSLESSFPIEGSIGGGAVGYYRLTADLINEVGGSLLINLNNVSGMGAYLIQTSL